MNDELAALQETASALQRDVEDLNLTAQNLATAMSALLCRLAALSGESSKRLTQNATRQQRQLNEMRQIREIKQSGVH